MQGNITLSKKEKRYQFIYLILMLFAALLFLGIIFLKNFGSPFNDSEIIAVQTLDQKTKFDQQQKIVQGLVDSTFAKINKLDENAAQPIEQNDIQYKINDIANAFQNVSINDPRKEGYPQIALFYKMYFDDKRRISTITENIKDFERQYEECSIGYREKRQNLFDKKNALQSR